jgi:MFS family permease
MSASASETPAAAPRGGIPGLPRNVVALGFVSLFTDVSTEMIIPVLPLFVTTTLGAGVLSVGLIEGVAESTASLLRLGSGWLSDRIGHRKPFLVFGYGISGVAKAAMALSRSWPVVLLLRFSDRIGKGLRNPPRDALIADSVDARHRGRAFGFHRALDTLGAAIGPFVAYALLRAAPTDYARVFGWSAVPAALSIAVLIVFVRAKAVTPQRRGRGLFAEARDMGPQFHRFLIVAGVFSLGNSSTAFLLLLAKRVGFPAAQVALVYLAYNLVYAVLSWPIGELSDRIGRRAILFAAYLAFALIYGALAWHTSAAFVVGGFVLLGVHSALLEGSQRSMLGDLVGEGRRGTAYGFYYTVVGAALLPASIVAGALWQRFGPAAMLATDAALALAAAIAFAVLLPPRQEARVDAA